MRASLVVPGMIIVHDEHVGPCLVITAVEREYRFPEPGGREILCLLRRMLAATSDQDPLNEISLSPDEEVELIDPRAHGSHDPRRHDDGAGDR